MPFPVMGLVPQASLEDANLESIASSSSGTGGPTSLSVGLSYTLWRNPDDRSDPANLAELDEGVRRSLDEVPPWPRPAWLVEQVERMRYPLLWETVRTSWWRDPHQAPSAASVLLEHANHVLMNRFRAELGLGEIGRERFAARLTARAVNSDVTVLVDGAERPGPLSA